MEKHLVTHVIVFIPGTAGEKLEWKLVDEQGTTVSRRSIHWGVDSEPLRMIGELMQDLVRMLRARHVEHFGH